jgi:hypothetical protein
MDQKGFKGTSTSNNKVMILADAITKMMSKQFGIKPKEKIYEYRQPYPEWFDKVPLPYRYKIPDFSKFSGQDNTTIVEHISRFLVHCGEASVEGTMKVRLFPLSLTGSALTCFSPLPSNSIGSWADLEKAIFTYTFLLELMR